MRAGTRQNSDMILYPKTLKIYRYYFQFLIKNLIKYIWIINIYCHAAC